MYVESFKSNTTHFDINFIDNLCILYDDSGTGKTYLFSVLRDRATQKGLSFCSFNYEAENISEQDMLNIIKDKDLVLFDNADLYMTDDIIDFCRTGGITAILSLKNVVDFKVSDAGYYRVIYTGNHLTTKRCR